MSLSNQNSGVMDALGQTQLEHLRLQATLHEVLYFKTQDEIKLHLSLVQDTNTYKTSQKGISFKKSFWIFLIKS